MKYKLFLPNYKNALHIPLQYLQTEIGVSLDDSMLVTFNPEIMTFTKFLMDVPMSEQLEHIHKALGLPINDNRLENIGGESIFKMSGKQLSSKGFGECELFLTVTIPTLREGHSILCLQAASAESLVLPLIQEAYERVQSSEEKA